MTAVRTLPRLLPSVLEVRVSSGSTAISEIAGATAGLAAGSFVRLRVGVVRPPMWLVQHLNPDLVYVIEGNTAVIINAWERAMGGDS